MENIHDILSEQKKYQTRTHNFENYQVNGIEKEEGRLNKYFKKLKKQKR